MWNSYGNYALNGVAYEAPPGFEDLHFTQVFNLPVVAGVALPHNQSVTIEPFTDQGSAYLWWGLELPPYYSTAGLYGYKALVQIYVNDEAVSVGVLNTASAWSNQSSPLPILPAKWMAPGTLLQIVVTSLESVTDYANFAIIMRGVKRMQKGGRS